MAFGTTNLQQVLAYLKGGHPIKPPAGVPAGTVLTAPSPPTVALPSMAQKSRQAPVAAPKVGP